MASLCPECGAVFNEDGNCQAIFDSMLVLEFSDPGYGAVHFLTVACFMIQHGRYSDEGFTWIEQKLRANLEEGITADEIRRQAGKDADQSKRNWKVTRQPGARPLPKIAWSITIADAVAHKQDSQIYCEWVKKWAGATLLEMRPLLKAP
jgi:hypothetical protein